MTTRVLKTGADRDDFIALLKSYKLPCTVNLVKGQKRSIEQNRLQRLWLREAFEQLGETRSVEEYRGYCKLHFGVPIMRGEDDHFRKEYDRFIRPLSYEDKLSIMQIPLDLPVTRIMKTGQKKRYLDDVYDHFTGLGVKLTNPEDRYANRHTGTNGQAA